MISSKLRFQAASRWLAVEHGHAVAHVVEGDPQLCLTVAQLLEQSGILDGDHRLISEAAGEFDLLGCKGFDAGAAQHEYTDQRVFAKQRQTEHGAKAGSALALIVGVLGVAQHVFNMNDAPLQCDAAAGSATSRPEWMGSNILLRLREAPRRPKRDGACPRAARNM